MAKRRITQTVCFGRLDVGQGNVNILQHLYTVRLPRYNSSTKLFLNLWIMYILFK